MKKLVAAAFAVSMSFGMVACSSGSDNAGKCPSQEKVDSWDKEMEAMDGDVTEVNMKEAAPKVKKVFGEIAGYLPSDQQKEFKDATNKVIEYLEFLGSVDINNPESISEDQMKKMESLDPEAAFAVIEKAQETLTAQCPDVKFDFGGDSDSSSDSGDSGADAGGDTATTE